MQRRSRGIGSGRSPSTRLLIAAAWYLAFQLRFDFEVPRYYETMLRETVVFVVAIKLAVFVAFGFYQRWWRYVSTRDMWRAVLGVAVASRARDRGRLLLLSRRAAEAAARGRAGRSAAAARLRRWLAPARADGDRAPEGRARRARPEGADRRRRRRGQADRPGAPALEVVSSTPVGLIDDDPRKRGMRLLGVRVLGTTDDLPHILGDNRPDEVLIAIPSAPGEFAPPDRRDGAAPSVSRQDAAGAVRADRRRPRPRDQIRPVQVEDVLGREPVEVDLRASPRTSPGRPCSSRAPAARSAPSSAARSRASAAGAARPRRPRRDAALRDRAGARRRARLPRARAGARRRAGTAAKLRQVFERYRPDVVFHAAAYKHVPLMEANPLEAVRNNVLATRASPRSPSSSERRALRARLDRQGGQPEDGDGPVEGALRVDRRGATAHRARRRDALRRGPLRQRARLAGQRDPDLPQADRARRAGDGHASRR